MSLETSSPNLSRSLTVLVVGSTGCIGTAVARALHARGHRVVAAGRHVNEGARTMHVDFMQPCSPARWAQRLREARIDTVVNAAGILMPDRSQSFEHGQAQGKTELFRGAALAGVGRIVQVSALGVGADAIDTPYIATKLRADDALAGVGVDHAIVRPSLVHGPGSDSAALFATLASLPVVSLPGRGLQQVQPIHVYEVAEAITRLIERPREPSASRVDTPDATASVYELGGPEPTSYRDMLGSYRLALGLPAPLWLPVPMPLMALGAWIAQLLPQRVFSRDTLRLLERGNTTARNCAPHLLGRAPTGLAEGLRVTPPTPLADFRVDMSAPVALVMRSAVAFMWLYTAAVTAWMPHESGVLRLLARCGFDGDAGVAMMIASCVLNTALGAMIVARPTPWAHALNIAAVLGYTATAAWNMPELTLDHCGPLVKNVPVLALLVLLMAAGHPREAAKRHDAGAASMQRASSSHTARHARA
jgi:uncharacterized protein YbjT (DUF2867 family)